MADGSAIALGNRRSLPEKKRVLTRHIHANGQFSALEQYAPRVFGTLETAIVTIPFACANPAHFEALQRLSLAQFKESFGSDRNAGREYFAWS